MKVFFGLLVLLGLAAALNSCSPSTTPINEGNGATVPGVGSVFTSTLIFFDTTGGTSNSIDTLPVYDTVIATNGTWNGRTVSYISRDWPDSSRTIIESNGDVSYYLGPTPIDLQDVRSKNEVDFGWVRLPIGSHTSSVLRTIDTSLQEDPTIKAHTVLSVTYLGEGSVRVGAELLPVSIGRLTLQKRLTNGIDTVFSTIQQEISFSSKIGYAAMSKYFQSTTPSSANENYALTQTLVAYRLR